VQPGRADAGRLAGKVTTVTSDKARKAAIRNRMAETGEPYSVASRAVCDEQAEPDDPETYEERYLREAAEAGAPPHEREAIRAGFESRNLSGQFRRQADLARQQADKAEEDAEQAEERAELAQASADLAGEWADEDEQHRAQLRADAMRRAADEARERADQAEEEAEAAEERAGQAEDLASQASELLGDDEHDEDEHDGPWSWFGLNAGGGGRPPKPPRPLKPPKPPKPPMPSWPRFR